MKTVLLLVCGAAVAACTASADAVAPLETQLYFPTGAAVSAGEAVLFVANANSDLRYDSGSISVIDLSKLDTVVTAWTGSMAIPAGCAQDPDRIETLQCDDQSQFMVEHAGVRIGNFATDLAVQDTGSGSMRLIVPTRGDPSIAWVDWDGAKLSCNGNGEPFALCDDTHRLTYIHDDPSLPILPPEPFSAFADSKGQYAMITHLTTGAVTLIDSPVGGDARIADVITGLFVADPTTGLTGSTGIAGRTPGLDGDIVYVGSRSEERIQTLTVGTPPDYPAADRFLIPGNWFFLDAFGINAGASVDTRGMAFSPTGDRLYLLNRDPPSLQVYDTSLGPTGFPRNTAVGGTDVCREASTLSVVNVGDGDRVFISCFQDGEIFVVDPRGNSLVSDVITVGHGPYAVVASAVHKKLYVTNFLENTVAVIDISPSSATYDRVVLRIGSPVVVP